MEARKLYFMVECFGEYVFPLYFQIKFHSYRHERKHGIVFLFPYSFLCIYNNYSFPFLITIIIQATVQLLFWEVNLPLYYAVQTFKGAKLIWRLFERGSNKQW